AFSNDTFKIDIATLTDLNQSIIAINHLLVQPTGHFFVSETDQILAATAQNHCGVQGWVMSANPLGSGFFQSKNTPNYISANDWAFSFCNSLGRERCYARTKQKHYNASRGEYALFCAFRHK